MSLSLFEVSIPVKNLFLGHKVIHDSIHVMIFKEPFNPKVCDLYLKEMRVNGITTQNEAIRLAQNWQIQKLITSGEMLPPIQIVAASDPPRWEIVDGAHRAAALYVFNPEAQVKCRIPVLWFVRGPSPHAPSLQAES